MSIQTILLVGVGLLVIFDAVITYTTYTATQREHDELKEKLKGAVWNAKDAVNHAKDNTASLSRLFERIETAEKEIRSNDRRLNYVNERMDDKWGPALTVENTGNTIEVKLPEASKNGKKKKNKKNK